MKKLLFRVYHKLFFRYWVRGKIANFSRDNSIKIIESSLFIGWLKISTEYFVEKWLKVLYKSIKEYDGKNTNSILLFPMNLRELTIYGYLINYIGMGYCPTLEKNPITLDKVLKLNPYREDKKWTLFLKEFLTYHWNNPDRRVTKNKLDGFLKH